jgi:hypothetical protein
VPPRRAVGIPILERRRAPQCRQKTRRVGKAPAAGSTPSQDLMEMALYTSIVHLPHQRSSRGKANKMPRLRDTINPRAAWKSAPPVQPHGCRLGPEPLVADTNLLLQDMHHIPLF